MYPLGDGTENTLYDGPGVGVYLPIDDNSIALNAAGYSRTRQEELLGARLRKSRMQFFNGLRYDQF